MDIINSALKGLTDAASGFWPASPEKAGLENGKLRPCPGTPNCVCSEYPGSPAWIAPLSAGKLARDEALAALKAVIGEMGGVLVKEDGDYLAATFTVPLFGFTDDVEFRFDREAGAVQVRSASRLGFSDLGVNRGRVEDMRRRFDKAG